MNWTFPEIKTTRGMKQRADKVLDEINEYLEAETPEKRDEEAVDCLHAMETFLRKQFKGREDVLDKIIKQVFEKNNSPERQYYTRECF